MKVKRKDENIIGKMQIPKTNCEKNITLWVLALEFFVSNNRYLHTFPTRNIYIMVIW